MSYYESQPSDGGQYAEGYEDQGYDCNYHDGNYQAEDGSQYTGTEWANNGESGYDPSWNADEANQYYCDENGAPYYDENGGYYDENGNYIYPNNVPVDDATAQCDTAATADNYTADAAALSPPGSSSSTSSSSLNPEQDSELPRSHSSNMLAQLADDFSLDSASSSTSSPSISMYLKSAVAEASDKTRPAPPRLRNGEIPPYYDDEETGYQYYVDDDGNTQWDLVGYYEVDGEYVYYEDVETEDSTRAFAEELENYKHQYNDDEKADKETDEERKTRHRAAVSKEIIETEKSYVESLDILVKKYMGPLVASGVLDKDARSNIFSNIPALYSLNNALLRDLLLVDETTKLTPTGKSFADIWLGTVEYFKMYSAYCTNYPNALKFTQALQKQKPQFATFCREMKNSSTSRLDLTDFLIKPVQRICKYPLLFRELIKNTDETDKEYAKLVEIEKRLQLVAGHVNEAKRMAENLQSVAEIASSITDMPATFTLVEGHRKLLFRGTYSVQTNNKTPKSSELILFSDVIVQARPRNMLSKQLKFVAMLSIRSIIVRDPGDTRLELEDEETNLVVDFKEPLEKKKWQTEVINTKQQLQEEEINKALKTRPKRRQKPGEPHREAETNKGGLYTGDQEMSPRSGDDFESADAEENAATSYDAIEKLIEKEEVRKREIDRRLLELDVKEKESRERLVAAKARNVELEREIAELQAKVQTLEVSASTASLPGISPAAAAPVVLEPAPPSSTFLPEQSSMPALLGPRSSTNLASTMRRPPPAPPTAVLNQS